MDNVKICLCGESAVGKDTVRKWLCKEQGFYYPVSHTTRPPREGEIPGVDYFFVSETEFEKMLDQELFVEDIKYAGHYYGITKEEFEKSNKVVTVAAADGIIQLRGKTDIKVVFLITHNENITQERQKARGDSLTTRLNRRSAYLKDLPMLLPERDFTYVIGEVFDPEDFIHKILDKLN